MSTVEFKLNPHPLQTTLGGISWIKDLRRLDDSMYVAAVENKQSIQLEKRAARVGVIDDYKLYFLTSRARIRLKEWETGFGKAYLVNEKNYKGEVCCSMCLTVDVPRNYPPEHVNAMLIVTPELQEIIREAGGVSGKFVGITMPPEAGFTNALTFIFKDNKGSQSGVSTNITPTLTRFIKIENEERRSDFFRHLHYNIHYIGQTTKSLEERLHAHDKVRLFADRLLTKELDQEPVIFAYTFSGGANLDSSLALDLIEAALITHFKPQLNIDKLQFPKGESPAEKNLAKRLMKEKITKVNISKIGPLDQPSNSSLFIGHGFTRDNTGGVRATSNQAISIDLSDLY